jgi:hypothetical protein
VRPKPRVVSADPFPVLFSAAVFHRLLCHAGMTAKNCLLLVIGDSFTREFWQDYFSLHAGKYIWIHHELCGFAVSVVEKHAPDIVILTPAERQMFCFGQ